MDGFEGEGVRIGTLFSGFGGVDIGAMAAGFTPLWAVEYDADIAAVYQQNIGDHVRVGDILTMSPDDFASVHLLHASPPCPNFSTAKAKAEETDHDIALARKVAEFIAVLLPDLFTLENVYPYRNSRSWRIIARTLMTHGYTFNYWHVCMADYGVPQVRRRMVVIARRDGLRPMLPPATHDAEPMPALFGGLARWVSWYEAIVDLIPGLPDSEFAPWQLARLSDELLENILIGSQNRERVVSEMPAMTIVTNHCGRTRAFIVNGTPNSNGETVTSIDQDSPAFTVTAGTGSNRVVRAFVCAQGAYGNHMPTYDETQPHGTITANSNQTAIKAAVSGRVVRITPRCLARLQSFPDWYELPESNDLAARGIGNAVPPLFYQRLAESLL